MRVAGPHRDVDPDEHGDVHPGRGMSVAADDPYSLLPHLLPPAYGGHAKEPLWMIADTLIRSPLAVRPAGVPHMQVEPAESMRLTTFEDALSQTRTNWRPA